MLAVNADFYSFEAANVRHEHEWRIWQDIKLPDGKRSSRGRHPFDQPDRAPGARRRPDPQFAEGVGRDHVIASTDCGLGGRVHPQLAWAKLEALSEGAELATKQLWAKAAA